MVRRGEGKRGEEWMTCLLAGGLGLGDEEVGVDLEDGLLLEDPGASGLAGIGVVLEIELEVETIVDHGHATTCVTDAHDDEIWVVSYKGGV